MNTGLLQRQRNCLRNMLKRANTQEIVTALCMAKAGAADRQNPDHETEVRIVDACLAILGATGRIKMHVRNKTLKPSPKQTKDKANDLKKWGTYIPAKQNGKTRIIEEIQTEKLEKQ